MKTLKENLIAIVLSSLTLFTGFTGFTQNLSPLSENPKLQKAGFFQPTNKGQILYDQTSEPSEQGGIISQFFPDYPLYTCQAADDFTVSGVGAWLIESVRVTGFYSQLPPGGPALKANVFIFNDAAGSPGTEVAEFLQIPVSSESGGELWATFPFPVELPQGHYWLSIQPVMAYSSSGMWYWAKQAAPTIGQEFCWRNPGGGFGLPGTSNWKNGSAIWGNQGFTDWNLGFSLMGTILEIPPFIDELSTHNPYPGQNLRIYGQNFGDFSGNCHIMINGILYHENITWWTETAIFFNFPNEIQPVSQLSLVRSDGSVSNTFDVVTKIPAKCYFLTPNENEELSENTVFISASAEILNNLIAVTKFYYLPEGTTDWIFIGEDIDGTSKTYGTTTPIGTGDGWAIHWDISGIDFLQLTLKAEMTDIFGHILTGERQVVIDKTPLTPVVNIESSKLFGGLALDNDSLRFDTEILDEEIDLVNIEWRPPSGPISGWDYERELEPIDQDDVEFIGANGTNVSDGACGPSAMASCLKWLAQQHPGCATDTLTVEELAQKLAREAGTNATGTNDNNLATAAKNQLENDPGIPEDFDVNRHFNRPSGKNGRPHNVYGDISDGLRDSADVVMLIYQKDANGNTMGHYVTASSYHTEVSYYSGDFGCAGILTSFVDFMDPATGEKVVKTITWYDNPPKILDYDLGSNADGDAWVEVVITIKPKNNKKNQVKNGLIASFPVNGTGSYQFSLPCSTLPEGVQMIGVFGVNGTGEKRGEYFACANGQYDVVAGFKADHTTWIPGYPVHFQNVSNPSDHITEYWWDLGDGSQTTVENPIHTYANTGIYNVKLAVSDGTKTDTLTRENFIQIIPATEQEILLFEGWNSLSSYVSLADSVFENLMSPIIENLVLVKNFDGFYWPDEEVNTLNYWHEGAGFSIKLLNDEIFVLRGLGYVDKNLQIYSGWGFLPVLSSCTIPVTEISDQLSGDLTVIKEISGNRAYWPAAGVTTLEELEPGRAYLIHLTNTATVSFPECEKQTEISRDLAFDKTKEPGSNLVKTPFTHLICVENPGKISPVNVEAICVFNAKGKCCGYSGIQKNGGNTVVAAFGDDPATAIIDGFIEGELMFFRLITSTGQMLELQPLSFDENLPDEASFSINGLSKINGFKTGIAHQSLNAGDEISIYPNPANDFIIIDNFYGKAILEMSTSEGKIVINQQIEGKTRINLDVLQSGLYFVRIISQTETWSGKIVVR